MATTIDAQRFHEAVAGLGWRLIAGGPAAYFRTDSFSAGAALVRVIADLGTSGSARAGGHEPHVDLRPDGVTVQLPILGPEEDGLSTEHAELAGRISAEADRLGLVADPSVPQTFQFCVDAMDLPQVSRFWRTILGGYVDRDDEYDLIDPHWRFPPVNFQQMDAPRPQRNRIHINLYLPYDQVEARIRAGLAAGGHLVSDQPAPYWWVLGDSEGNEVCVVPTGGWVGEVPTFGRPRSD